eukprot:8920660-Heterocapsa_arctica.AAC.1
MRGRVVRHVGVRDVLALVLVAVRDAQVELVQRGVREEEAQVYLEHEGVLEEVPHEELKVAHEELSDAHVELKDTHVDLAEVQADRVQH